MAFATFAGWVTPAMAGEGGGVRAPGAPTVSKVRCVSTPEQPCRPARALLRRREFVVAGSGLGRIAELVFEGRRGSRDDVRVRPREVSETEVVAVVPSRARTGRLSVADRYGNRTRTAAALTVRDAAAPPPIDITPSSRFFFDSRRKPTFTFDVPQAADVQVELLDSVGSVVRSWTVSATPGGDNQVTWDGLGPNGVEPVGNYAFRIADRATAATPRAGSNEGFVFADHLFPIRGRHNLGYTQTNNFGGGRGHQGQDMFARCGTRLAAARGGRVEYAGYHAAAGNYVVIDGAKTGVDYAYMHMLEPPLVKTGQRVFTGQKIGEVGETGRATGCHLHFEMWSAPGWYKGGNPFDPLPLLKRWDSYS
ncbi:MAG TPA: peptidoglycan DD-metalloendopeptidase family protein [Thermoleophilaceae bacterium]|nr:peptidoglycan DD-metalloendopeptidase family protein [Thermoleophilaceae bacterium]